MAKENTAPKTEVAATQEATYEAKELAQNSPSLFGYSIDIATAALAFNRIECTTVENARKIIKNFAERKVN